jgi:hypothetical protein
LWRRSQQYLGSRTRSPIFPAAAFSSSSKAICAADTCTTFAAMWPRK